VSEMTAWSVVLAAGATDSMVARPALQQLCSTYWYPLYSFVRRQGHGAAESEDITQSFFASLLARNGFQGLDPSKGRFRTFLLAAMRNHMSNLRVHGQALKRGGGKELVSLDAASAEDRFVHEPPDASLTPERAFDRQWALALLDTALRRLRDEYELDGKAALFDALQATLSGDRVEGGYLEVASRLGTTEGALKVAAHRLRQRYRQVLLDETADTTGASGEAEGELRDLLAALSG
jgi:RNA polymerase sigma factor (sigma-70 family)